MRWPRRSTACTSPITSPPPIVKPASPTAPIATSMSTGRATCSRARARAARAASCIAARAASTGTSSTRRRTRMRRSARATSTRRPSSKPKRVAREAGARGALETVIVASDRHLRARRHALPQDVPRDRPPALPDAGLAARCSITSPTSTISSRGSGLCGEAPQAAGRTYILAGPRYTTLNELARVDGDGAGRRAAVAASARSGRSGSRAPPARRSACRSASSRRCTVVGSTSTRRAAPSTPPAPAPSSATRRGRSGRRPRAHHRVVSRAGLL